MSYKKIVCPIGDEDDSRAALEIAARLARKSHGTVYMIHVVPLPTSIVAERTLSRDRERAQNALERLAAQLPVTLSRVTIVRFGNLAREIAAVARRIGADLIVIGTHDRTLIARFFQESVAQKVVANAPCPVLALPLDAAAEALNSASQAA
jgi:nucleotide-binding universal stress UspA family protein